MSHVQFKDDVAVKEQIKMLFEGAILYGVPIVRRTISETEAYFSITYSRKGEEKTLVARLKDGDKDLMDLKLRMHHRRS